MIKSASTFLCVLVVVATLTACNGGGGGGSSTSHKIAGTVSVLHAFNSQEGYAPYGSLIQANDGNFYGMTTGGGDHGYGTVFKITPSGKLTVLKSMGDNTGIGRSPHGSLIEASDGNLYGMARNGGTTDSLGTVFKITKSGTLTVLHAFEGNLTGTGDGSQPWGSLIEASDGKFYGMTAAGGANDIGTVFKITKSGTLTVLHAFEGNLTGTGDGSGPNGSLIEAGDGNLYGMTAAGGANDIGTVFKITKSGTLTVLHAFEGNFTGTGDGSQPWGSLIEASDGNLYGMTNLGGKLERGTVFKITKSGSLTVLHAFDGTDGMHPYGSLIEASDGNLYGITFDGGGTSDNLGAVFKITKSGTLTVLHAFEGNRHGTGDGAYPFGSLIEASDGNLYGMTSNVGIAGELGTVIQIK